MKVDGRLKEDHSHHILVSYVSIHNLRILSTRNIGVPGLLTSHKLKKNTKITILDANIIIYL